jgi:hypothetical protein
MSENLNRRAALGALASAPALALASSASPVHPDAALFAMQSAIDAADRELEAAQAVLNPAQVAYFRKRPDRPAEPEVEFLAEERQAIDLLGAARRIREGKPPLPDWVAHGQAVADYERECERLEAECGVAAAEEMQAAAHETISQVQADLVGTPAKTLAGLIFKARYAAAHYEGDYDDDVMSSIVDDLLAMADEPEGLAEA